MDLKYSVKQVNGQRIIESPSLFADFIPKEGSEVFVGKLPRTVDERELHALFSTIGLVYQVRLMIDFSSSNRGFAFVCYVDCLNAHLAVKKLNNFEIRPKHRIGVRRSVDNRRLLVKDIPTHLTREEIWAEFEKYTTDIKDVTIFPLFGDKSKHRGFAYIEYVSHKAAASARRQFALCRQELWNIRIQVDWALPKEYTTNEPGKQIVDSSIVKYYREMEEPLQALLVRDILPCLFECSIWDLFSFNKTLVVTKVKKMDTWAFVHFRTPLEAQTVLNHLPRKLLDIGIKITSVAFLDNFIQPQGKNSSRNRNSQQLEAYMRNSSASLTNCNISLPSFSLVPMNTVECIPTDTQNIHPKKYIKLLADVCYKNGLKEKDLKYDSIVCQPRPNAPVEFRCRLTVHSLTVVEFASTPAEAENMAARTMLAKLKVLKKSNPALFNPNSVPPIVNDVVNGMNDLSISESNLLAEDVCPINNDVASGISFCAGDFTRKKQNTNPSNDDFPLAQGGDCSRDSFLPIMEPKLPQYDDGLAHEAGFSSWDFPSMPIVNTQLNNDMYEGKAQNYNAAAAASSCPWNITDPEISTPLPEINLPHNESFNYLATSADVSGLQYDATQKVWRQSTSRFSTDHAQDSSTVGFDKWSIKRNQ